MENRIIQTLIALRAYALQKGREITLDYHEEDSYLMRFANSAISLNTNEHLIRLEITAYDGRKRASYGLITDLEQLDVMKRGIDTVVEMVQHAMPLNYEPTIPVYTETFVDEDGFDAGLAQISNEERLAYFNRVADGLETSELKLSGIFACGYNVLAQINTRSEHYQFFKTSDAQISTVLSHATLKWEVTAEQSAQKKADLTPELLHDELAYLVHHYQTDAAVQVPLGEYDIVFGSIATADLLSVMNWIGFNGGLMKRGYSFLKEENVGQKVFSDKFNLVDNPTCIETYPLKRDLTGIVRRPFALITEGKFQAFAWSQDDADEFGAKPTGHTVTHKSLVLQGGSRSVGTLQELVQMKREKDILYIPFLHYMNFVNPSKGVITASSRFGALMLRKNGTVEVPYNVRITQSLLDIFGEKVEWMSKETVVSNTSSSYGARNPTAVIVPKFIMVKNLEISHSNSSY
jgi:predicted Zn-dependent protease